MYLKYCVYTRRYTVHTVTHARARKYAGNEKKTIAYDGGTMRDTKGLKSKHVRYASKGKTRIISIVLGGTRNIMDQKPSE